jgi:hypothetical protein
MIKEKIITKSKIKTYLYISLLMFLVPVVLQITNKMSHIQHLGS